MLQARCRHGGAVEDVTNDETATLACPTPTPLPSPTPILSLTPLPLLTLILPLPLTAETMHRRGQARPSEAINYEDSP